MAMNTGHGGSVTFGTSSLTYFWRKIGAVEQEGEAVEDSDLDNTYFKSYLPGDVVEPGEFEIEYAFDSEDAQPDMTDPETITLTLPLDSTQSSAYNVAGTGYVLSRTVYPECASNGLQIGKMKIAFDGLTGPTPTVGS